MKDQVLFLNTEFSYENLFSIREILIKNGWVIKTYNNKVTIFESKEDENYNDVVSENEYNSYEESLLRCLFDIQNYYKRVLN